MTLKLNKPNTIQEVMHKEMHDKSIFDRAQRYAYEYIDEAFDRHVYPKAEALKNLSHFEEDMPELSSDGHDVIDILHRFGSPATSPMIGGRYFGLVNGGVVPTGLAARWLGDVWDQNTPLYVISPIASKLEAVVELWMKQLLHLPKQTVAGFVSGSSMANFCGLAAARWRVYQRMNWDCNEKGMVGAPRIRIVAGRHVHSSIGKAISLLGFGSGNTEWVDVDDQGRILSDSLPQLDETTIVILQAGNVGSGSFDAFAEICAKARKANAWVHIDGAFGLWAAATERFRNLTNGIELADSWAVDGHKTLNTPYDSGIVLCADEVALTSSLHSAGSYIVRSEHRDGMFYTPEMSRRARIVELWATLKYLGKNGIEQMILGLHERAVQFGNELKNSGFEVLNDVVFNQVLVSCGSDELTDNTLHNIQELRECWCGGSEWFGSKVIRISVCSWATSEEDVIRCVKSFVKAREMAGNLK